MLGTALAGRILKFARGGPTMQNTTSLIRNSLNFADVLWRILMARHRAPCTLTTDDDLAGLLKRRARELGLPFKEMVDQTLRAGLGEQAKARPGPAPKTISHSFGFRPGIDLDKLNQLADKLEAETYAAGQRSGRRTRQAARRKAT
jgi:hypothetical protein